MITVNHCLKYRIRRDNYITADHVVDDHGEWLIADDPWLLPVTSGF